MSHIYLQYKKIKGIIFFKTLEIKRFVRKIIKKPIYHVIGDSHTLCFQHESFIIHHIGPATAYRLNFEKSTIKSREKVLEIINKIYKNIPINILFVFGELDTRIHINKISNEKNISKSLVIDETIKSYMNFLKFIKKEFPLISVYVFNILPQGEEGNRYKFPFYANRQTRSKIAEEMNKKLKKSSSENKFKYIYIYDKLIDKDGNRIKKYVFDEVHFNRKIMPFVIDSLDNKST